VQARTDRQKAAFAAHKVCDCGHIVRKNLAFCEFCAEDPVLRKRQTQRSIDLAHQRIDQKIASTFQSQLLASIDAQLAKKADQEKAEADEQQRLLEEEFKRKEEKYLAMQKAYRARQLAKKGGAVSEKATVPVSLPTAPETLPTVAPLLKKFAKESVDDADFFNTDRAKVLPTSGFGLPLETTFSIRGQTKKKSA